MAPSASSSETTPLLGADRGAPEPARNDTWRFNAIDRPLCDVWGIVLFVLALLAALAQMFYFLEFDPRSQPLHPAPFPSYLLRLLAPLALSAPLAVFGCRLLVTWTKNVTSPRGLRWMLLAFAVLQVLSVLSLQTPNPTPSPPSPSSPHDLYPSLATTMSLPHHSAAAKWLLSRTATWKLFMWGPPSAGADLAPVEEVNTSYAGGVQVFAAAVSLSYAAAAVLVIARCSESLRTFAPVISRTAGQVLSYSRPLPGITVAVVATATYIPLVVALSISALIASACKERTGSFSSGDSGVFGLYRPLAAHSPLADVSIGGVVMRELATLMAQDLNSTSASVNATSLGAGALSGAKQCDAVTAALIPDDITGALFTVLGCFVVLWAYCLGQNVLKYVACVVVSESSTNPRTEGEGRDQWVVLMQGFRMALRESLGSLCILSGLSALGFSCILSFSGAVALGFISWTWAPYLLALLQLGLVMLELLLSCLLIPLVAISGKSLWSCLKFGFQSCIRKFSTIVTFLVCVEACLSVLTVVILLVVSLGSSVMDALLSLFQRNDISAPSTLVLTFIPSCSIGIFANVLGAAMWSTFIGCTLAPEDLPTQQPILA